MSKLLLDSQPLVVIPELATLIGLNEAIILQQIHYWINIKKQDKRQKPIEDTYWVYNTYEEWREQFPFWSNATIRRIIGKLEKANLLYSKKFNKVGYDQTKWYSINYEKLNELINKSTEKESQTIETTDLLKMSKSNSADCTHRTDQNEQIEWIKMSKPIPETTTEISTDIVVVDEPLNENYEIKTEIQKSDIEELKKECLNNSISLTDEHIRDLIKKAKGNSKIVKDALAASIQYSQNKDIIDFYAFLTNAVLKNKVPSPKKIVKIDGQTKQKEKVLDKYKNLYINCQDRL